MNAMRTRHIDPLQGQVSAHGKVESREAIGYWRNECMCASMLLVPVVDSPCVFRLITTRAKWLYVVNRVCSASGKRYNMVRGELYFRYTLSATEAGKIVVSAKVSPF